MPIGGGVPAWTLNNHDVHRSVSRYGLVERAPMYTDDANARRTRPRGRVDVDLGVGRARAAALLLLALPGSIYLYQGEELGLPEVMELPDGVRRDPIWARSNGREHGRDGCRIPLPWQSGEPTFGFSPPGAAAPWLPQPEWFARFAVDVEDADRASTLHLYRAAIRARRGVFAGESIEWLDAGRDDLVAFRRGSGVSVTVTGESAFVVPPGWGSIALRSGAGDVDAVAPDETVWLTH